MLWRPATRRMTSEPTEEGQLPSTGATINGLRANPGDHICAFYRGRAERDKLVVPFLKEGLLAGDKCICITGTDDHHRLESALLDDSPEIDRDLLRLEHYDRTCI